VARGFEPDRVHVSYPGVDHAVFHPPEPAEETSRPTAVYIGRLRRYKGLDILLRALARLREAGVELRLVVAGQGDDRGRLERLAQQLGLGELVSFRGFVSEEEKVRALQTAWMNVYPSPKEGWGITNVEAAACGTPSVASDSPGLRESVRHRESGFLVPHDDVEAWAAALRGLVENADLRRRLGIGATRHAARFTWEATSAQTEAILRTVASR
jgi:glycosyltransferase involved in cell wall biosynthesis